MKKAEKETAVLATQLEKDRFGALIREKQQRDMVKKKDQMYA